MSNTELTNLWKDIEEVTDALGAAIAQLVRSPDPPHVPLVQALITDLKRLQNDCATVRQLSAQQQKHYMAVKLARQQAPAGPLTQPVAMQRIPHQHGSSQLQHLPVQQIQQAQQLRQVQQLQQQQRLPMLMQSGQQQPRVTAPQQQLQRVSPPPLQQQQPPHQQMRLPGQQQQPQQQMCAAPQQKQQVGPPA